MSKTRRLAVESLETRAMLAGNVQAFVDGGTLFIRGDDASNGVAVHQLDTGRFVVTGFSLGAGATRINGAANGTRVFGGVRSINVDMNAGNDVFVMSQSANQRQNLANELSGFTAGPIAPSPGAANPDTTEPLRTRIIDHLIIRMGAGNDGVGLQTRTGSVNRGSGIVHVMTHVGADRVILDRVAAMDDILVETGRGNDRVDASNIRGRDFFFVNLADGNDRLSVNGYNGYHSFLKGGAGNDVITLFDFNSDLETLITGGAGQDNINVRGSTALELRIIGGLGNDNVRVVNSHFGDLHIHTGDQDDFVRLDNVSVVDEASVELGAGDDLLEIRNSSAATALADGGDGFDTLDDQGGNNFDELTVVNFERRI